MAGAFSAQVGQGPFLSAAFPFYLFFALKRPPLHTQENWNLTLWPNEPFAFSSTLGSLYRTMLLFIRFLTESSL